MTTEGEQEQVCSCSEPKIRQGLDEEEVAVRLQAFGESLVVPIDTAALSIWVDHGWFAANGGKLKSRGGAACAADGGKLGVVGTGTLQFEFWQQTFTREVRVMSTLPDRILIGRRFWRENGLILDLEKDSASILVKGTRVHGALCSRNREAANVELEESVCAVIEDADVDDTITNMDLRTSLRTWQNGSNYGKFCGIVAKFSRDWGKLRELRM